MSLSNKQKQTVRDRAGNCCEYCRLAEAGRLARFHVDHIIAKKHNGGDDDVNLCLACPKCNAYKSENVAALEPKTGEATKLYDARQQNWNEHFTINADATLSGLSPEGRATVEVLRINLESRIQNRLGLIQLGEYPCEK